MNPLFNRVDIFSVIEHQKQELKNAFQKVTNAELDADSVAVVAQLIEQFSFNVTTKTRSMHLQRKHRLMSAMIRDRPL
jgi:hypothetical protein